MGFRDREQERAYKQGQGWQEVPALAFWLAAYSGLGWAASHCSRWPHMQLAYIATGLGRAGSKLVMGLGLVPIPDAVAMVIHKNLELVTDLLMYTPLEQ
ncbi:hypothetical protein HaLaN_27663, partial [Haematococcus lacustris]